ncbi:MAG TPA: efflux transporter outer membrane subunit [Caulobacteraceae bacterium]|jgi:NodT family efflux transporter outer membrane factor (OMF) lipoprotein
MKGACIAGTVLLAALGLTACTVGPRYSVPQQALVHAPAAAGPFVGAANPALDPALPPDDWWRLYQDPRLDVLIRQAFAANTDLRVAEANLERSHALLQEVRAARQPGAAIDAGIGYDQLSAESYLLTTPVPPMGLYDSGISVSYDLDLFGRLRRAVEAASADDEAAAAARDLVKVNVAAETTRAYVEICDAGAELAVAHRTLDLQEQEVALTRRLVAGGRAVSLDETRAQEMRARLAAEIPTLEARQRNAVLRLTTLVGRPPAEFDRTLELCRTPPRILAPLPVGDGAALLERRPDVRGAERRLAASTAEIGVATAALYPDVTFGASAGSIGAAANMLSAATNAYGLGPTISWQVNRNAVRARIAAANAETRADLARFDSAVLDALRETESALNIYGHDLQREASLQEAVRQADRTASDARRLQAAGKATALAVLDADRSAAAADEALAGQASEVSLDQVGVFLALGGGWR